MGAPDRPRWCHSRRTRDPLRGDMACDGQYRRRGRCAARTAMRRAVRAMLNNRRARLGWHIASAAHGAGRSKAALGADLHPRWRRARRERVGDGRCKRIQQDRYDRNPDPNSPRTVVRHIVPAHRRVADRAASRAANRFRWSPAFAQGHAHCFMASGFIASCLVVASGLTCALTSMLSRVPSLSSMTSVTGTVSPALSCCFSSISMTW